MINYKPSISGSYRAPITFFRNVGRFQKRSVYLTIAVLCPIVLFCIFCIFGGTKTEAKALPVSAKTSTGPQKVNELGTSETATPRRRKVVPASGKEETLRDLLVEYTQIYEVELSLVMALMKIESGFKPNATSPVGASGLMQLMPDTARNMGLVVNEVVDERLNPAKNLEAGIRYLRLMLDTFDNPIDAIAAYNVGPQVIKEGLPTNTETLQHVYRVMRQKYIYDTYVSLIDYDIDLCTEKVSNYAQAITPVRISKRKKA